PTEGFLVQVEAIAGGCLGAFGIEFALYVSFSLLQLVEEFGTNGEQVRSGQKHDLVDVAEAGAHHLGLVAEFLVVVVNTNNRGDTRILIRWNLRAAVLLLVPVINTADEGGNQSHSRFGARNCLGEAEEQGQVAVNAFSLQPLGRADAFPGVGDLDQNPRPAYAFR